MQHNARLRYCKADGIPSPRTQARAWAMGPAGALLRSLGEAMQPGEGETARVC